MNNYECFVATLMFGATPVLKKIIALDKEDAITTILQNYENANIVALFSLTELEQIMELCQQENIFFVNETIFEKNKIIHRSIVEKNTTLEKLSSNYENRNCIILNNQEMKTRIALIFYWLENEGKEETTLQSNSIN